MATQNSEPMIEPLRKTVTVKLSLGEAFELFTSGINRWWPLATHSVFQERATECVMEQREGGELYEIRDDGERSPWGTILTWDPPRRVVFQWHPGRDPETAQQVEIRFSDVRDATIVELVHSGWEKDGEGVEEMRGRYSGGWDHVLGRFVENAGQV